ncbi:hypothetical protein CBM2626_B140138 [Cupriavidus taiwanensis]|nr:hypothetical protein CBM2626_B140138 [Cupriavidus taiwanensis]
MPHAVCAVNLLRYNQKSFLTAL